MVGSKKRMRDDTSSFKKKIKSLKSNNNLMDPEKIDNICSDDDLTAELLDFQTVREGMLLLGCVTEIEMTMLVMSLPGCLSGIVPVNNISCAFTKALENFTDNCNTDEPCIDSIIKVGMVFPCKVIQISKDSRKGKPSIILSINPQDVNADLKPSSLYSKMVLFASVCSIEDHGYIMDVGTRCIQGFLPKQYSDVESKELKVGEVIPAFVLKMNLSDKFSAKIQLSRLDFNDDFPQASSLDMKLSCVLPGTKIQADVIEVKHPFVYMKYLCFDACANVLSLGSTHKTIEVGSTVFGTVLYVHPVTHLIYLMLSLKPSPDLYAGYFGLKKFESLKNLKFQCLYKNRVYYKIAKGTYGFTSMKDLRNKVCESSSMNHNLSKACVLSFHYMDNLVQITVKPSMVNHKIIFPEDVQIADVYDAEVKKHVDGGMFVCICPGLCGFVRRIHMSDVFVTKPELIHPVGSKIKCRVLSTDGKDKLCLTCKESLVNLQERYILSSYDVAQRGQFYKGVVVQKTDTYILVAFFNDVTGIVSSSHIPKGSVFHEGQIVLCEILESNPSKKKLKLSFETGGWCSIEEVDDLWDEPSASNNISMAITNLKRTASSKTKKLKRDSHKPKVCKKNNSSMLDNSCKMIHTQKSDFQKPVEALILKVKGSQLDILLNKSRGRVHVTELGCTIEDIYPLKEFSAGQKINVYITGEYSRRNKNYLEITHRNMISFKECVLNLPSVSSSNNFSPGTSLIGFVKEVYDVGAVLWLSPTETGVLDFIHFSENPKVVRKLQRYLMVGLSLKVSILDNQWHSENGKSTHCITLTKIDQNFPQVGKNILGLVQIGCLDRGLIVKLPFGYHGVAAITDLTDIYVPVHTLLEKYRKLKFLLCHILEVDHQTKYCQISLRKSRVYKKKITSDNSFCPEILLNDIREGDAVKGFIKSVSKSTVNVLLGKNIEGKVHIHNCSLIDCDACSASNSILDKFPVGGVIEVIIEKSTIDGKSFNLVMSDSKQLDNSKYNRLIIREDISWDEIE